MVELELNTWLKAEDIKEESVVWFTDEGQMTEMSQGEGLPPKRVFEIGVVLGNGEKRVWTMNQTTQRAIAGSYGTDTKQWLHKPVKVFTADQNVRGEMKKVLYARAPTAEMVKESGVNPFQAKEQPKT